MPLLAMLVFVSGCNTKHYRLEANKVAYGIIDEAQRQALGKVEPFTIEPPADTLRRRLLLDQNLPVSGPESLGARDLPRIAHWPEDDYPPPPQSRPAELPDPVVLTLLDALQVAAANNRDYQSRKEDLFRAALTLDLQANQFRNLWDTALSSNYQANRRGDDPVRGLTSSAEPSWRRRLVNGTLLTADFAVDLANLLSADRASSWGVLGDATISVPLLRGSGRHIVTEPLTQAERDVVYSLFTFERFKSVLVVRVASDYLGALQQLDQVRNAEENYRGLIVSTRRALHLYDAGRLPQIQVDQARQDELRARDRWISAQQAYVRSLDTLKGTLGLPTDAEIALDRTELENLTGVAVGEIAQTESLDAEARADDPVELVPVDPRGGPLEIDERRAIEIALANRVDLQTALGQVYDAQRKVVVAADSLRAELTLTGSASVGERRSGAGANQPDAEFRVRRGLYAAGVLLDLPLERTAERNDYRNSLINMDRALRSAQALEDQVKLEIRNNLRSLLSARESYNIQLQAVEIAQRRVQSTALFLEAGRAEIRDVLDAQEALISAKNSLTSAKVTYRLAELGMQRDMGVLEVDEKGIWREYTPETAQ
jgi:outer membrane protein TolC